MNDKEVIGSVRFSFAVGLKPWNGDPTEYFFPVKGEIVACLNVPGDPDATELAGRVELKVIKLAEAFNDHIDLSDVFHEASLGSVYLALFNQKGDFKKKLEIALLPGEVIFIDAITIESKYQPTRLVHQAIESMIPALSSMGLVVACRDTLDRGHKEWKRLGFDRVPRTDFIVRDDFNMNPKRRAY